MPVVTDPEGVSAEIIREFFDFRDKQIFEIGCGRGRITMAIAEQVSHVTAIDPVAEDIKTAQQNTPDSLKGKIDFIASSIEDFILPEGSAKFDLAFFTWSL